MLTEKLTIRLLFKINQFQTTRISSTIVLNLVNLENPRFIDENNSVCLAFFS